MATEITYEVHKRPAAKDINLKATLWLERKDPA